MLVEQWVWGDQTFPNKMNNAKTMLSLCTIDSCNAICVCVCTVKYQCMLQRTLVGVMRENYKSLGEELNILQNQQEVWQQSNSLVHS